MIGSPAAPGRFIKDFPDGSGIIEQDDGSLLICARPANGDDPLPYPVPQAWLYYWSVIRNRPDIKTWEQIRQADKEDEEQGAL